MIDKKALAIELAKELKSLRSRKNEIIQQMIIVEENLKKLYAERDAEIKQELDSRLI